MNTAIRNNNLMRTKRERFKKTLGGYDTGNSSEFNLPKASEKQLRAIRKRLKTERQLWWLKMITLTIIGIVGAIVLFYFLVK